MTKRKNPETDALRYGDDVYLIIADETEEFQLALRYVALLARDNLAKVAILHVMDKQDFQHWGGIENRMRWEQRYEGEKLIWAAAQAVYEISGTVSALYLEEGGRLEVILDVLKRDLNIRMMVLAGSAQSGNPGPLVSYFTGKGLVQMPVPLTIVPGNLTPPEIDSLI